MMKLSEEQRHFLPEYNSSSGGEARLQVLIRVFQEDVSAGLRQYFRVMQAQTTLLRRNGFILLTVTVPAQMEDDLFLQSLAENLDRLNTAAAPDIAVDLVETRRVAVNLNRAEAGPPPALSSRFQLASTLEGRRQQGDKPILLLDSGRVFGSGVHPSTRLALQAMEELADQGDFPARVLDFGCGSGLLGLASTFCGAQKVVGLDICPEALAVSKRNVKINGLSGVMRITAQPLHAIREQFDLILANLTISVMTRMAPELRAHLEENGILIASGLQGNQACDLEQLWSGGLGGGKSRILEEGPWRCLLIRK